MIPVHRSLSYGWRPSNSANAPGPGPGMGVGRPPAWRPLRVAAGAEPTSERSDRWTSSNRRRLLAGLNLVALTNKQNPKGASLLFPRHSQTELLPKEDEKNKKQANKSETKGTPPKKCQTMLVGGTKANHQLMGC